jgi:DNA (cytosine-5)-methyltransferase 1
VAQRRRRVFVVGYLGDWQRAAQVLFERESVRRDTPPSREARQGAAAGVGGGPDGGRIAGTVSSKWSKGSGGPAGDECYNMVAQQVKCATGDITHALTTRSAAEEDGTGRGTPLVPVVFKVRGGVEREDGSRGSTNIGKQAGKGYLGSEERAFTLAAAQDQFVAQPIPFRKSRRAQSVDDHETWVEDGIANTLNCHDVGDIRAVDVVAQPVYGTDCYNGAITGDVAATLGTPGSSVNASGPTVMQPIAFKPGQSAAARSLGAQVDIACTLEGGGGGNNKQAIAQPVAIGLDEEQNACVEGFGTLKARMEGGGFEGSVMTPAMQVRRLTPVECERLQGFPDGYTNIPWRKKDEAPDGPRYKALGNSMAVPCMAWIGKRIAEVDRGD